MFSLLRRFHTAIGKLRPPLYRRDSLWMSGQRLMQRMSPVFQSVYSVSRMKPGSITKWSQVSPG
jgi:hypothetical protein